MLPFGGLENLRSFAGRGSSRGECPGTTATILWVINLSDGIIHKLCLEGFLHLLFFHRHLYFNEISCRKYVSSACLLMWCESAAVSSGPFVGRSCCHRLDDAHVLFCRLPTRCLDAFDEFWSVDFSELSPTEIVMFYVEAPGNPKFGSLDVTGKVFCMSWRLDNVSARFLGYVDLCLQHWSVDSGQWTLNLRRWRFALQ